MCAGLGRYDEALVMQRRAQELDPLAHPLDVATTLLRAGRYDEAARDAVRALEFDADNHRAHATLGWAHLFRGKIADGLAELERAAALSPGSVQWLAQLGQGYALAGQPDRARDVLRQLDELAQQTYVSPYHRAFVYTGLGEHDVALDLLERALDERAGAMYGVKGSFLFAPLRSHPRFQALLRKMNLV